MAFANWFNLVRSYDQKKCHVDLINIYGWASLTCTPGIGYYPIPPFFLNMIGPKCGTFDHFSHKINWVILFLYDIF